MDEKLAKAREAHLTIRPEQFKAFEDAATRRFELEVVKHVRKEVPDRVASLRDCQLQAWVHETVKRAGALGLRTERQIACLFDSEVYLGIAFYDKPEHLWAAKVLASESLSADEKAQILLGVAFSVYSAGSWDAADKNRRTECLSG